MSIWWSFKVTFMNVMFLFMIMVMNHMVDLSHFVINFDLPNHWVSVLSIITIGETVSSYKNWPGKLELNARFIFFIEITAPFLVVLKIEKAFWTLIMSRIRAFNLFDMLVKFKIHLDHLVDDVLVIAGLLCFTAHLFFIL